MCVHVSLSVCVYVVVLVWRVSICYVLRTRASMHMASRANRNMLAERDSLVTACFAYVPVCPCARQFERSYVSCKVFSVWGWVGRVSCMDQGMLKTLQALGGTHDPFLGNIEQAVFWDPPPG